MGDTLIFAFPMDAVIAEGGELSSLDEFFEHRTPTDVGKFFDAYASRMLLTANATIYIPYGYVVSLWATTDKACVLYQPIVNSHLANAVTCSVKDFVIASADRFLISNVDNPNGVWTTTHGTFSRWVAGL